MGVLQEIFSRGSTSDGRCIDYLLPREPEKYAKGYNPDEPRNSDGEWTVGGGSVADKTAKQTDSPAFKKWFGDSKVVDESGDPLEVYHGTGSGKGFNVFDSGFVGEHTEAGNTALGFFFTDDIGIAEGGYSGTRGAIMPAYLAIQKPLKLRDLTGFDNDPGGELRKAAAEYLDKQPETPEDWNEYKDFLVRQGYDGIEFSSQTGLDKTDQKTYVAFRSEQIKSSTGNKGTFDASNPDIRYSKPKTYRILGPAMTEQEFKEYLAGKIAERYERVELPPKPNGTNVYVVGQSGLRNEFRKVPRGLQRTLDLTRIPTRAANAKVKMVNEAARMGLVSRKLAMMLPESSSLLGIINGTGRRAFIQYLRDQGYDSIQIMDPFDAGKKSVIVFDENQLQPVKYAFVEAEHPRVPKGKSGGGKWTDSGGGAAVAERPKRKSKAKQPAKPKSAIAIKNARGAALGARLKAAFNQTPTETPAFKKWFGASKITDADGKPLVLYHGSTNKVTQFNAAKANPENSFGAGFYFTNTPEDASSNYADIEAPDLHNKISQIADSLRGSEDDDGNEIDDDTAHEMAVKQVSEESPNVSPVYLKMENPLHFGGDSEPRWDLDYEDDEHDSESDDYDPQPKGKMWDFLEAVKEIGAEYSGDSSFGNADMEKAIQTVLEAYPDGAKPREIFKALNDSDDFSYAGSEDPQTGESKLMGSEIIRAAIQRIGYDGVIDHLAYEKWGKDQPSVFRGFRGMTPDTLHYIAFNPNQIKSAIGNSGAFDSKNPDIRYRRQYQPDWQYAEVERYKFDPAQPRVPKGSSGGGKWTDGGRGTPQRAGISLESDPYRGTGNFIIPQGFRTGALRFHLMAWLEHAVEEFNIAPSERQHIETKINEVSTNTGNLSTLLVAVDWNAGSYVLPSLAQSLESYGFSHADLVRLIPQIAPEQDPGGQLVMPGFGARRSEGMHAVANQYTEDEVESLATFIDAHLPDGARRIQHQHAGSINANTEFTLADNSKITLWDEMDEHSWNESRSTVPLTEEYLAGIAVRLGWDELTTAQWNRVIGQLDPQSADDLQEADDDAESKRRQEKEDEEKRRQEESEREDEESSDEDNSIDTEDVGDSIKVQSTGDVINNSSYSPKELADLVGAQPGSELRAHWNRSEDSVVVEVSSPDISSPTRYLYDDHIYNSEFFMREASQGKGLGAKIFAKQVEGATRKRLEYIKTNAGGDGEQKKQNPRSMNGYYTWPRFGYDADIPYYKQDIPFVKQIGAKRVSDIINAPGGLAWWKENGWGGEMRFDLTKGSYSRKQLAKYLREKRDKKPGK